MATINKVHKVPAGSQTIDVQNIGEDPRALGTTHVSFNKGQPHVEGIDFASTQGGEEITAPNMAVTVVHEMGHAVDALLAEHVDLPPERIPKGMDPKDVKLLPTDFIKGDPRPVNPVMKAIGDSRTIQELMAKEDLDKNLIGDKEAAAYDGYLLDPQEAWARAYAQWVAERGDDPELSKGIGDLKYITPLQWPNDDFAPIAKAFDDYFRERGLTVG